MLGDRVNANYNDRIEAQGEIGEIIQISFEDLDKMTM